MTKKISVMKVIADGCIERVELEPYGLIRCVGWSLNKFIDASIRQNGILAGPLRCYRRFRADVKGVYENADPFSGFAIEFYPLRSRANTEIIIDSVFITVPRADTEFAKANEVQYGSLISGKKVLHRSDIYGVGLPADETHPEIHELAGQTHLNFPF